VELATWRLEMDMHFDYTMATKALATAILDSVGASNQAALKVAFHPKPLHFLTPQEIVDEMLRRHAALTGPDLQKLRAPLHEPLVAITELERHMTSYIPAGNLETVRKWARRTCLPLLRVVQGYGERLSLSSHRYGRILRMRSIH
jgi:hypothetical protein